MGTESPRQPTADDARIKEIVRQVIKEERRKRASDLLKNGLMILGSGTSGYLLASLNVF
jgi:hypothetical protein